MKPLAKIVLPLVLPLVLAEQTAVACPACLGQPASSGVGSYALVALLIVLPFVVGGFAIRAIARL